MVNTRRRILYVAFVTLIVVGALGVPTIFAQQTPGGQRIADQLSDYERLKDCTKIKQNPPKICLQVPFGGKTDVTGIAEYINLFYRFFVGIVVTFAIFMIVVNGFKWLFSRGNSGIVDSARKGIGSAIGAVALVFVSVAMLRIINPDLISLEVPGIKQTVTKYATVKWCKDAPKENVEFRDKNTQQTVPANEAQANSFPCGTEYEFYAADDPRKEQNKVQCLGHVCQSGFCDETRKECTSAYIAGTISSVSDFSSQDYSTGSSDQTKIAYPVKLALRVVCDYNNASQSVADFSLLNPFAESLEFERGQTEYHFFITDEQYRNAHGSGQIGCPPVRVGNTYQNTALVGYVLQATIYDFKDQNDDFLLRKDCTDPISDIPPSEYKDVRNAQLWEYTVTTQLFTDADLSQSVICNLDVNRQKFPRR